MRQYTFVMDVRRKLHLRGPLCVTILTVRFIYARMKIRSYLDSIVNLYADIIIMIESLCNGEDFWKWRQDLKAQRQSAYYCYTCSEEVIFHGTRIRYNLDGTLHLCKPEDKEAYRQYCEQHKDGDGEDFWKYKRDLDEQRWRQTRDNYSKLLEEQQRKLEEEQKRQAAEEQRHKAGAEEEQRRVAQEQRKRAANEKRRATRERNKRAKEERKRQAAEEQQRHAKAPKV